MAQRILIVDDEQTTRGYLTHFFEAKGYTVTSAPNGRTGLDRVGDWAPNLVLLDLRLPDMDGVEVLDEIRSKNESVGVVMITGHGDVDEAVRAMRAQADHFVLKPVDLETLDAIVQRVIAGYQRSDEITYLRKRLKNACGDLEIGRVLLPEDIAARVKILAESEATSALILGETGTGKGVTASLIHELSIRSDGPFIDINCAGLTGELLESELFGHERGAFTDAKTMKKGLFELADGGSLFLDEIGNMPLATQSKLLKVLETRSFRRVGGTQSIHVNVRIMAATNTNLERAVAAGTFRSDLFFRINVVPLVMPPLRERSVSIPALAHQFANELSRKLGKPGILLSKEAVSILQSHSWPGNIRELRNTIERAVLLSTEKTIRPSDFPDHLRPRRRRINLDPTVDNSLAAAEKRHIREVLDSVNQNRSHAAEILSIHRSTLINKLKTD